MSPTGPRGDAGGALTERGAAEQAALLASGETSSVELVAAHLERIEALDPLLRSVLVLDERVLELASEADRRRRSGACLGPLAGVPVLVKDNVETAGALGATAGSLALSGSPVECDAPVVERLRRAGAIVIGKTNLSEWANFRSRHASSGWSAAGGQCRNPHVLDRTPSGSSSGSGVAVASGFASLAVGTETDGSIVCPASANGVVGVKPTHGLVPADGVVPLASSQDTVGFLARSVVDAALALGVCADGGVTLARYLDAATSSRLDGVRIGVTRRHYTGNHPAADALFAQALLALEAAGAVLVDPVDLATAEELAGFADELLVLMCEFHDELTPYLARRNADSTDRPRSLAELIAFNEARASEELVFFGQDIFVDALATGGRTHPAFAGAFARNRARARDRGLDAALTVAGVEALVTITMGPAGCIDLVNGDAPHPTSSTPAAVAGYPALTVPIGTVSALPVGLSIVGPPHSEARLLNVGAVLERALGPGARPGFLPTVAPAVAGAPAQASARRRAT